MKKLRIVGMLVVVLVMIAGAGVVYATHGGANPELMTLEGKKFNYLELTGLSGGSLAGKSIPPGTYAITIVNNDKTTHVVEFEKGSVEFGTVKIRAGQTVYLNVTLAEGEWLVYCPLHMKVKPNMSFKLTVVKH